MFNLNSMNVWLSRWLKLHWMASSCPPNWGKDKQSKCPVCWRFPRDEGDYNSLKSMDNPRTSEPSQRDTASLYSISEEVQIPDRCICRPNESFAKLFSVQQPEERWFAGHSPNSLHQCVPFKRIRKSWLGCFVSLGWWGMFERNMDSFEYFWYGSSNGWRRLPLMTRMVRPKSVPSLFGGVECAFKCVMIIAYHLVFF